MLIQWTCTSRNPSMKAACPRGYSPTSSRRWVFCRTVVLFFELQHQMSFKKTLQQWFDCMYSWTLLYRHLINTDNSLLWIVVPTPLEADTLLCFQCPCKWGSTVVCCAFILFGDVTKWFSIIFISRENVFFQKGGTLC